VRIRPFHEDEARPFLPGLLSWADESLIASTAAC